MNNSKSTPTAKVSSKRSKIIAAILLLGLVTNLLGFVGLAFATSCGDYDCVDRSDFDTDDPAHGGWLPSNSGDNLGNTELGWLATKSFGLFGWGPSADGVLTARGLAGNGPTLNKSVYLQPGTYRLVMRVGSDRTWGLIGNTIHVWATPAGETFGLGAHLIDDFLVFITDEITISSPGDVGFEISGDQNLKLYFDYIWVVQSTAATPTPGAGTPTATSIPATATPIPTSTPFCVSVSPTATAGPPQFDLTPTATPIPIEKNFAFVDDFAYLDLVKFWKVAGSGVHVSFSTGRTSDNKPGAVFIPYSVAPGGWDYLSMARDALIGDPSVLADLEQFETPISGTIYVYAWGRANFMPQDEAGYVEIWTLDADTLLWSEADAVQVSTGSWYNFNDEITATSGVLAIAFLASRSDGATSDGLYLDDIAIYQDLQNAPTCGGFNFHVPITGGVAPPGTTEIPFPIDKPCPPDLIVPNNFWGPLIAQLTLGLDRLCAPLPVHKNLSLADKVRDGLNSPVAIYVQFLALFFDLRIPFAVLGVIIAINVANMILEIWLRIKELIPFL